MYLWTDNNCEDEGSFTVQKLHRQQSYFTNENGRENNLVVRLVKSRFWWDLAGSSWTENQWEDRKRYTNKQRLYLFHSSFWCWFDLGPKPTWFVGQSVGSKSEYTCNRRQQTNHVHWTTNVFVVFPFSSFLHWEDRTYFFSSISDINFSPSPWRIDPRLRFGLVFAWPQWSIKQTNTRAH